jgi:UDP:flavonoid glycosyltransferase YjiC (YdhE family)
MKKRVYASVFGSGLGHASRTDLILKRLAADGWQPWISSFGEGLRFLQSKGYEGKESPAIDVKWTANGSLDFAGTLRRWPIMVVRFLQQMRFEIHHIRQVNPHVVISDSRLSAILAARLLRVPVIVVTNVLTMLIPRHDRRGFTTTVERIMGEILSSLWSLSKVVAIPDLPPPYTISDYCISPVAPRQKVRFIGFLAGCNHGVDGSQERNLAPSAKPLIFCPISGPTQTKFSLLLQLKEIATSSQGYDFIISAGVPGGSSEPKQFRGGVFFEWCPNVEELAHRASVIVSRAGHTSIAKAVLAGKPLITIPIERQTEQVGNAQRVQRLGIGMMINQRELDPGSLLSAVRLCLNSSLEIEKKANNLRNVALQHDGAEAISRIVEELKA